MQKIVPWEIEKEVLYKNVVSTRTERVKENDSNQKGGQNVQVDKTPFELLPDA